MSGTIALAATCLIVVMQAASEAKDRVVRRSSWWRQLSYAPRRSPSFAPRCQLSYHACPAVDARCERSRRAEQTRWWTACTSEYSDATGERGSSTDASSSTWIDERSPAWLIKSQARALRVWMNYLHVLPARMGTDGFRWHRDAVHLNIQRVVGEQSPTSEAPHRVASRESRHGRY